MRIPVIACLFVVLLSAGCLGAGRMGVDELDSGKEGLLGRDVQVYGTASYSPSYCTEMFCFFESVSAECAGKSPLDMPSCMSGNPCEPGERMPCNTCGGRIMLSGNGASIELRRGGDSGFSCSGREVLVCGGPTEYEFEGCAMEEGAAYLVSGRLMAEDSPAGGGKRYYVEVSGYSTE